MKLRPALVLSPLLLLAASAGANSWTEVADAPELPPGQSTIGSDPLELIEGSFADADDVDLYAIRITDAEVFSATGLSGLDLQLFLFTSAGLGIASNDDDPSLALGLNAVLPAGHPLYADLSPGTYLLGVSVFDVEPLADNLAIFPTFPFTEVHGPTGPGGPGPVTNWAFLNSLNVNVNLNAAGGAIRDNAYTITLSGAGFAVPEPTTAVLLGAALVGALGAARRHRA
ncbi:MAG: DVUA0089 family protein [Myxococcota bacterium]|nr:DVUA0089 family protein [Myxococcota bacterium]